MSLHASAEHWVSVDEIADHLKVKPDTVYKWLERKDMPAHNVGRLWRFKTSEVDSWVRSGGAASGEAERSIESKRSKGRTRKR